MYQKLKYTFAVGLLLTSLAVNAQVTIQSPYSKFGVGNIKGTLLPQLRAMGGISTAVGKHTFFNNINMQNPASYATINTTTLDLGLSGSYTELKNNSLTETSFNANIAHVALAFPVTKTSALSFGILPYSELGYNFKNTTNVGNTTDNQKTVSYLYTGEGGLTKAYLGYGKRFGDHLRLGANIEYVFGNLIESRSTEYQNDPGSVNSRIQDKNSVGGVDFSYGAQYDIRLDNKTTIVLGYSGVSNSTLNSKQERYVTQYITANGNEGTALDTVLAVANNQAKLKLPLVHNFGIAIQKNDKWLIGMDYRMGKWSDFSIAGAQEKLQDTYGFSVGGQLTPDFSSINNYFKRVEYRMGFQYDKTYIQMNNQDIKQMAVTFGLGLPLSRLERGSFYKMNITAELGQRGSLANGLLQERYINFHLGFTLNDSKWFQRFKFD
ncbi:MAG: outer membrane protein transport protein [Sphingobacteriaceae bacterium]|jgi:long-subunit fatty acid transport protein|nr:outer membrane protein transport protein [Sphingobacteriaceae bacterium]